MQKKRLLLGWLGIGLTLAKPLLMAVLVYFAGYSKILASLAISVLIISDILDGVLFRASSLSQINFWKKFRRYTDVIGDKLIVQGGLIFMISVHQFPLLFYWLITTREFLFISIVIYGFFTHRPLRDPNNASRVSILFDALACIAWMFAGWNATVICLIIMAVFGITALRQYYQTIQATMPQAS